MADEKINSEKIPKYYIPRRYILCAMMFGGFLTMNCQRSCLSVAIVAMTSKTRHWEDGKWVSKQPEFDWDSEKKGMFLGAFFYGYLALQIPSGSLCMRFGGKKVLGFAVLTGSIINALLPILARYNEDLFFAFRVLQGFVFGAVLPTNHYMWGRWAPTKEKGTLVSISISGLSAGMLLAYPVSGLLCTYGFSGGWPSVFYFFGGIGVLWALAWYLLAANSPTEHKSISKDELAIMDQIDALDHTKNTVSVPWSKLLCSIPVWAIVIANFTFDSIYYTLLITMPLFLRDVHKFNVATTGFVSAMPWLFMTIMISTAGVIADRVRKNISVGLTRKILFNVGVIFSSFFLIVSGYVESSEGTIAIMCISVAFFGFEFSGFMVNPMDIAPKYAGTVIGLSNSIGSIPGFVGPAMVGVMTKDGTAAEWLEVFYVLSVISIIGGILYAFMGSGEKQSWATYEPVNTDDVEQGSEEKETKSTSYPDSTFATKNIQTDDEPCKRIGDEEIDSINCDMSTKNQLAPLEKTDGEKNIDKLRDSG